MYPTTEKLFLFNPYDIQHWSEEQLEQQARILLANMNQNADTMYEMALNVEILSNLTYIFGEEIARLGNLVAVTKLECDTEEAKLIHLNRKNYALENPNDKVPAMSYFEAKAKETIHDKRIKQLGYEEKLTRFKKAYDSYENIMNAIKKKMESVKYETGL